jgi:hypothetical protein
MKERVREGGRRTQRKRKKRVKNGGSGNAKGVFLVGVLGSAAAANTTCNPK